MSDENEEITNEEDPVGNILNPKTAIILTIFLVVVILIAFVVSFINFEMAANRKEHVKYFWVELNIPKGYPDTVYKDRIIYMDTLATAHDTVHHDTVVAETKTVAVEPPHPAEKREVRPAAPARQEREMNNAPAQPVESYHLSEEDKSNIVAQIESIKKSNNIQSNDIEIAHVYHTNGTVFMQELEDFLRSKGYKPDDGNGSRMIFGNSGRRGWWVSFKQETKKVTIGIGMF